MSKPEIDETIYTDEHGRVWRWDYTTRRDNRRRVYRTSCIDCGVERWKPLASSAMRCAPCHKKRHGMFVISQRSLPDGRRAVVGKKVLVDET